MTVNGLDADKNKQLYVIVCDDSAIELLALQHLLKKVLPLEEVEVLTAKTGYQVLQQIKGISGIEGHTVVLLLSDWKMPNMTGDELFRKVHEAYPWVKLVMISGHSEAEFKPLLGDIPYRYLPKPVRKERLSDLIESIMIDSHLGK